METSLSPDVKNEQSSQDFAPIDSNKLGIYFSPTDVINEDIVHSIADLSLDDLIRPRDEFKYSYKTLGSLQRDYFKRYNSQTNNFFDYLRDIKFL